MTILPQTFAEQMANEYGVGYGRKSPMTVGTIHGDFDKEERSRNWPFRELVGSLM